MNDCLNAVRTLVADDQELEIGILPALAQYNSEQFVNVEFQGKNVRAVTILIGFGTDSVD